MYENKKGINETLKRLKISLFRVYDGLISKNLINVIVLAFILLVEFSTYIGDLNWLYFIHEGNDLSSFYHIFDYIGVFLVEI